MNLSKYRSAFVLILSGAHFLGGASWVAAQQEMYRQEMDQRGGATQQQRPQQQSQQQQSQQQQQQGDRILEAYRSLMGEASNLSSTASGAWELAGSGGERVQVEMDYSFAARGPNRVNLTQTRKLSHSANDREQTEEVRVISDSEAAYLVYLDRDSRGGNIYRGMSAPRNFWQFFDPEVLSRSADLQAAMNFFDDFKWLYPGTFEGGAYGAQAGNLEYRGRENRGGRTLHRFERTSTGPLFGSGGQTRGAQSWNQRTVLFFESGDRPMLRRIEFNASPSGGSSNTRAAGWVEFHEWDLESTPPSRQFVFRPSGSMERVDSFIGRGGNKLRDILEEMDLDVTVGQQQQVSQQPQQRQPQYGQQPQQRQQPVQRPTGRRLTADDFPDPSTRYDYD